jgi:hypothetical protein
MSAKPLGVGAASRTQAIGDFWRVYCASIPYVRAVTICGIAPLPAYAAWRIAAPFFSATLPPREVCDTQFLHVLPYQRFIAHADEKSNAFSGIKNRNSRCRTTYSLKSDALSVNAIDILPEIARDQEQRSKNRDNVQRYSHLPSSSEGKGETLQRHG